MTNHYLWYRSWPFFTPAFPFDRFDALVGKDLVTAMTEFANEWQSQKATAVETKPGKRAKQKPALPELLSFAHVAPLAGWVKPPSGPWVGPAATGPLGPYEPRHLWYFHVCADLESARTILTVLRKKLPSTRISGGSEILRYGTLDASSLKTAARIALDMDLAEYLRLSRTPGWGSVVLAEMAKLEPHINAGTPTHAKLKQPPIGTGLAPDRKVDSSEAVSRRLPLSDAARAVLKILEVLPETEGRTALELVQALKDGKPSIIADVDRIKGPVKRELIPYGIDNKRGAGYFIPMDQRRCT